MLALTHEWVWDFWLADDGDAFHLFFLVAPKNPTDPDQRHRQAKIGHAVSQDLRSWTRLANAVEAGRNAHRDDVASWTGSIVRGPDLTWHLFYTGLGSRENGYVQRICLATSRDLTRWENYPQNPVLLPDARWYDVPAGEPESTVAWRDPWVFFDPDDQLWHMLITAHAGGADDTDDRGVVGHATSPDLVTWQAHKPLTGPGTGFGHFEVLQVERVGEDPVLMFSCGRDNLRGDRRTRFSSGGIWATTGTSLLGPFDTSRSRLLFDEHLYVGRMISDRHGDWKMLAFNNIDEDGSFIGTITDPMPLPWGPGHAGLTGLH